MERDHPCTPPIFSRMGRDKVGLLLDHIESTANPVLRGSCLSRSFWQLFEMRNHPVRIGLSEESENAFVHGRC